MATNATSPTALRWELARRLKELRTKHDRSLEDVARELMCSTAKVSRMETGARGVHPRDVRDLCRFYGVSEREQAELMRLATESGRSGWWSGFRTLNDETAQFVGLESAAIESWISNPLMVPGLLQTAEYTAHLLRGILPPGGLLSEAHELIEIRQRRQSRVSSGELSLRAIVDEGAVRRPIAPAQVMVEQVDRLIVCAEDFSNVQLQVVPYSSGSYPGMNGGFQYMHFTTGTIPDVVFVEGHVGIGMFLTDRPSDTERYRTIFEDISRNYALAPGDSRRWLRQLRTNFAG